MEFTFSDKASNEDDTFVIEQLKKHNGELSNRDSERVSLYFRNETNEIVAGLLGKSQWGGLLIEILWVHEEHRGSSLGSKLIQKCIQIAEDRNCQNIIVETMGFQAKDFYLKQGFEVFGTVENTNPELNCYYMKKLIYSQ